MKRGFKKNVVDFQFSRVKAKSRESLVSHERSRNMDNSRVSLVVNFQLPILHASENMKKVFGERPMVAFRRPRNLKDELVRSTMKKQDETGNDRV